jgi:potassium efflux system protein
MGSPLRRHQQGAGPGSSLTSTYKSSGGGDYLARWLLLLLLLLPQLAWSQATSTDPSRLQQGAIDELIAEVEAEPGLEDQSREELLSQLQTAGEQLDAEAASLAEVAELNALIDSAGEQVNEFKRRVEEARQAEPDAEDLIAENASLSDIESQTSLLMAKRRTLAERRSELLEQMDSLQERTTTTREELSDLQGRIDSADSTADIASDTLEQRVARAGNQADLQAWEAEKKLLEMKILSEPARDRIASAERTWLNRALADIDLEIETLVTAAKNLRADATNLQLETTAALEEKLESDDPVLREFASTNRSLAERLQSTASEMEFAMQQATDLQAELDYIEQDSHLMRRRLDVAGRKEVLGRVMITRLDSLPNVDSIETGIKERNELIASTSLAHIDADEEFRTLVDRKSAVAELLPDPDNAAAPAKKLVEKLVDDRQALLTSNLQSMGGLLRQLVDNNIIANQLIERTDEFHKFLLGNLLWVRNFDFISLPIFSQQMEVLLSPIDWARLPADLIRGTMQAPWSNVLLLLWLAICLLCRQLKKPFESLVTRPMPLSTSSIWHIVVGLCLSFILVLPWPLLLSLLGYFLGTVDPASEFLQALSPALLFGARLLYILLLVRLLISKTGVGRRLLKWDARNLDALRSELDWAGPLLIVCGMLHTFSLRLNVVSSGGPLGAIATLLIAASIIAVCIRLLRREVFAVDRPVRISLRVCVALAAVVIIMQVLGLMFAADVYLIALSQTVLWMTAVKVLTDILERWLLILRAKITRQAREEKRLAAEEDEDSEEDGEDPDDRFDVQSLSEAHAKLLYLVRLAGMGIVLWVIWSPSLPALNLLESITLWEVADHSGGDYSLRAITLFDLMLSVLVLVATGLVARHLPSLLQVFMVEWLKISPGARYASGILMQYVVIAVGGAIFLNIIGWEWSKVQWLVAALGVGIGFGLQEIVANFISGLIILFERPIRVGDTISAGGAEGVVQEIKPRATVIRTFDGKEHLIPNKELITGQVINWSLSENAVRVVIPIGIAYGSNVRQAMSLLLESAREVDLVLAEPEPMVTFEDFGDNALVLWLRCYVAESRPAAWTALRIAINEKFEAAGISISFPQRDVHLNLSQPLNIQIDDGSATAS